jgi:hypothetical protein
MLVKVFLGYAAGIAKPTAMTGPPVFGQMVSEHVRGVLVVELWPVDFALNTRASTTHTPLHTLWHPRVSAFLDAQFGVSGMERLPLGAGWRWVAQRWLCEPRSLASIQSELRSLAKSSPREIGPCIDHGGGFQL